jgi:hypothetical protein
MSRIHRRDRRIPPAASRGGRTGNIYTLELDERPDNDEFRLLPFYIKNETTSDPRIQIVTFIEGSIDPSGIVAFQSGTVFEATTAEWDSQSGLVVTFTGLSASGGQLIIPPWLDALKAPGPFVNGPTIQIFAAP